MKTSRLLELAGLSAKAESMKLMEAINDEVHYVRPEGIKKYGKAENDSQLNGTVYDPDTGEMSVLNKTSLSQTHHELLKRGWVVKKNAAGGQMQKGQVKPGGAQGATDKEYALGK